LETGPAVLLYLSPRPSRAAGAFCRLGALLRDTDRAMPKESTTPDRGMRARWIDAANRRDLDTMMRAYAPDCVAEMETATVKGVGTIRSFLEEWLSSYEELKMEAEEILDLGNGVVFSVIRQRGRPVGSDRHVQMRAVSVIERTEGLVTWMRLYTESDIEKARAAAERLAEERG
jgi:ketosteroid isomerase-like protein